MARFWQGLGSTVVRRPWRVLFGAAVTVGVLAARLGRAFVASGLTLVGGFAVLVLSPMPLLRDFGIVVALDVLFALATTLVLLPPLLVWADERE